MKGCEWSILANPNWKYNCIAYSVDITDHWLVPLLPEKRTDPSDPNKKITIFLEEKTDRAGRKNVSVDKRYGNGNNKFELSDMDALYLTKGLHPDTSTLPDETTAEVLYYSRYHAAKRRRCSCGSPKWVMFESKCGDLWVLEHLSNMGGIYGVPTRYYKK